MDLSEFGDDIFAVGHSTHPLDQFIEVLQAHQIQILADIRTVPRSRTNPQFNQETLARELPRAGIRYIHLKELGGLRRPQRDFKMATNLLRNTSLER